MKTELLSPESAANLERLHKTLDINEYEYKTRLYYNGATVEFSLGKWDYFIEVGEKTLEVLCITDTTYEHRGKLFFITDDTYWKYQEAIDWALS